MLSRYPWLPNSRWRSWLLTTGLGLAALAARPIQAQTLTSSEVPTISGGAAATMHPGPTVDAALAQPEVQASIVRPMRTQALRTFSAIDFNGDATSSGYYHIPPDPSGAAGPNHVVNVVNTSIEWFRKIDGVRENRQRLGKNSTTAVGSFFEPLNPVNGTFDPKVIYDQYEHRFVVVTLERTDLADGDQVNGSRILLAVSDDDNPNGTWYYYSINSNTVVGTTATWGDYPGLAIDDAAIYVTANLFTYGTSGSYRGSRLWILGKGTSGGFYGGLPATSTVYDPGTLAGVPYNSSTGANSGFNFTLQPAHMFGTNPIPGGGTFLVAYNGLSNGTNEALAVYTVSNPLAPGGATFSLQTSFIGDVDNTAAGTPSTLFAATQLGSSNRVDMGGRRMQNAVWRNNTLYATTQVNPNSAPDAGQGTALLAKLNTTDLNAITSAGNTLFGAEDLGAGTYTGYPNVAVDATGRALVGLAASGPSIYPGAYYAVVPAGSNTAGPTQTLQAGLAPYYRAFGGSRNRWGDYSGTSVDPADGSFWLYNEYASTTGTVFGSYPTENGRWATLHGNVRLVAELSVTTQPATGITGNSATLNATVNPNGGTATVTFRYGTTLGTYTNSATVPGTVIGTTDQAVSATITGLSPATTYYFVAEVTDGATTVVGQPRSFTTAASQGVAKVLPKKVTGSVAPGGIITRTLTVRNTGIDPLTFSVRQLTTTSAPGSVGEDPRKAVPVPVDDPEKGAPDLREGIGPDASGGPDAGGYRWVDSDNTGGPAVDFVDISTVGTQLTAFTATGTDPATDEGYATTTLPFDFPFYGATKTAGSSLYISANGILTFSTTGLGGSYSNQNIPATGTPNDVIAPFWDDLELGANGKIFRYYDAANNRLIIEYQNVQLYANSSTSFTFEVILSPDGTVVFQYGTMSGTTSSATVGIENANGTIATRVVFNAAYVKSNLATRISTVTAPTFITGANPLSGTVQPGETATVTLTLRAGSLAAGTYSQSFAMTTNGLNQPVVSVPVFLTVTPTPTPGTVYTVDTPGAYVLETLFFEASNLTTPGDLNVVVVPGAVTGPAAAPITALSSVRRYDITFTGVGTFDVTFPYGDEGIADPTKLRVAHRETSGDTWTVYPSYALNTTAQTITATGVTSFSQWALATVSADVPLAVELSTFGAQADEQGVTLSWATASERQNAGFSVLRSEIVGGAEGTFATMAQHTNTPSLIGQGTTAQAHRYSWRDERVTVGHTYRYSLLSTDISGETHRYPQTVEVIVSEAAAPPATVLPTEFALSPASPNPFNPTTSLRLDLPQASTVTAEVYSTLGQRVRTILQSAPMPAGQQSLTMDGAGFASGAYLIRVVALGENGVTFNRVRRVMLAK